MADVNPHTGQSSPKDIYDCYIKNKIKKLKAFFSMYNGGAPNDVKKFFDLKKKLNCYFIEDACHALGSKYSIKTIGRV